MHIINKNKIIINIINNNKTLLQKKFWFFITDN